MSNMHILYCGEQRQLRYVCLQNNPIWAPSAKASVFRNKIGKRNHPSPSSTGVPSCARTSLRRRNFMKDLMLGLQWSRETWISRGIFLKLHISLCQVLGKFSF